MSVCSDVISFASKSGADECEAILCTKKIITIRITDSEIAEIKENYDKTIGIRLIKDKKISSVESTILDLAKLVTEALQSGKNLARREFWNSFPGNSNTISIEKTNDHKIWSLDSTKSIELAQTMIDSATHHTISRISGSLNIVCDDFEIQNTSGLAKSEKSTYISGVINADSEISTPVSGIGQVNSRMLDLSTMVEDTS